MPKRRTCLILRVKDSIIKARESLLSLLKTEVNQKPETKRFTILQKVIYNNRELILYQEPKKNANKGKTSHLTKN